jgi:hypothetical protein
MKPEPGRDQVTYRRTELYEQVWKEPVRTCSARLAMSPPSGAGYLSELLPALK